MLTGKNVVKALVVSVALAFVLSLGSVLLFSTGISTDPAIDWERVNSMTFLEATAYIDAHTTRTTSWETLKIHVQWLAFLTPQFFALIATLFAGSLVLLWWARR